MAGPWEEFAQNSETESGPWADFSTNQKPKKQDNALVRGLTQANSARKTFGALTTGDYESAAKLAAERDAYQRANPGTPEGNELMAAWEKGDGVIGGIKGVAGEFAKDWREAPTGIAALQATGKNLSAMGGGIVEQIPNMVMPMAGMLAGGAAGSLAGPVGTVGGAFAGAATGNTAAESAEQVDRAIRGAGINPQDTNAVRSFLEQDAGGVLGKSAIKGGIIGAVDTATMGIGGKMLRAPVNAATDRAIASLGINAADKAAVSAAREQIGARVLADPIYQASQKGVQALARNATVGALEPVGEFAGEYLGQGAATGDWDTKGAMLEALSSLGQSGITYAGQKIYQAATSPLRGVKADQTAPQDAPTIPPDVSLTSDPVPVQQRIDTMLGLDATRMDDKGRKQYEADLVAAFNEPIGIRLDANQNEVPYTMGEYLDSQIKIADNERAKPMRSSANQQATTRLDQLAEEEAQQHAAITQDLVRSAAQGGALSKAALTGIQTGATQMPVHPERAAIEQQMLADEAAQAELAPIERLMRTRSDEQVQRIAENENANPKMRQVAIADLQRRMATKAQPTTTRPLPQTATQFNLPENSRAAQPVKMAQAPQETNAPQDGIEQGAAPQARIKQLQAQLKTAKPFERIESDLNGQLISLVTKDAEQAIASGVPPTYSTGNGNFVVIHPSAQKEGMIQVTRYTDNGVFGDSQYKSIEEAVRDNTLWIKERMDSNDAVAVIEKSIQAEAEYQQRKNAAPQRAKVKSDSSLNRDSSWVIRNKETGEVVMETFDRKKVDALNTSKYEAVPIQEYLGSLDVQSAPNAAPVTNADAGIGVGGKSGIAKGASGIAQRQANAANNFIDSVQEQFGLSKEDAGKAWDHFVQNKLVKIDAVGGQYSLTDGRLWDGEVMRRAANNEAQPKPKAKPNRREIDSTKDTLFQAIAKLGGMDTQELTSNGFDQKDISVRHNGRVIQSGKNKGQLTKPSFKSLSLGFNMPLHKKGGMSFDGVLEELKQHGYFPEDATKNDAIEAFRRELGGDAVMTPDAAMQQAEMQAEQEENDAIGYDDLSDREKALVDFHAETVYDNDDPIEAFKRGMKRDGATEDEINEAIKQTFGAQETGNNDSGGTSQGTGETRDAQGAWNGSQDGEIQESAEPDWLTGQTNEQAAAELAKRKADIAEEKRQHEELIAKAKRESNAKEKARRAAQVLAEREAAKKAEVDKAAEDFALGQEAPAPVERKVTTEDARGQQDVFAQPAQGQKAPEKSERESAELRYKEILSQWKSKSLGKMWKPTTPLEIKVEAEKLMATLSSREQPAQEPAQPVKATTEAKAVEPAAVDAKKEAKSEVIEGAGEKLEFARKYKVASMAKEYSDQELANLPLSKIWPADEIDSIEDAFIAAVSTAARAEIPAKPRKVYKVDSWVNKIKALRGLVQKVINSTETRDRLREMLKNWKTLDDFYSKVVLLESIDRAQWKRIGYVRERPDAYQYKDGNRVDTPMVSLEIDGKSHWIDNAGSVHDALDKINKLLGVETKPKLMEFEVRGKGNSYFINKKGDREYRKLKTFTSTEEAFKFRKENYDELVSAWEAVKDSDNVKKTDVRNAENRPRTGQDWRKGKNVDSQTFIDTFGFRAADFGNWVKQGDDAKERQGMLNQAYDALMDLSEIVGLPPKAISLNGTLALGFGLDGKGWASAHFSPDKLFINLTKTRGAGSIAHEWLHALDNYFARMRNDGNEVQFTGDQNAYRKDNFVTYKPEAMYVHKTKRSTPMSRADLQRMHEQAPSSEYWITDNWEKDKNHPEGIRPQVEKAFSELVETLNASPMLARARKIDKGPDGYWSRIIERGARSFENYVIHKMMEGGYQNDYLANVKSAEDFSRDKGRYPYLLPEEVAPVAEAFDNLFNTLETKETDKGIALMEESAVYNVNEPDAFTGDIFQGTEHALPETKRRAIPAGRQSRARADDGQGASRVLAVREAADTPGVYHVSAQLVTVGERQLPVATVKTSEDAARAFAHLSRFAVEHMDGLVTDKDGKPLAIIGAFKGAPTQASVYSSTLMMELARIDGAANLWLSHNHPSGMPNLSEADRTLSRNFRKILRDTSVTYQGLSAMARRGDTIRWEDDDYNSGEVSANEPTPHRVPIVERELVNSNPVSKVGGPQDAKRLVPDLAKDSPGVVFLTAQNEIASFVPFSPEEMGELRSGSRLMKLFNAAAKSGATGALVAMPDGKVTTAQFGNLKGALGTIDVGVFDGIRYDSAATDGGKSVAESGEYVDSVGANFFSRGNGATQGQSFPRAQAESRIKSILGDKLGKVLIDSGIVSFTNKGNEYQGATYKDGSISLNLDALNADNFAGVLQHEGFHSTIRDLVGEQTYTQMMKRLDTMLAMGKGAQWVKDAEAAIPSDTKAEHRTEEIAAYSIEQYVNGAKQPNIIKRWVESLLSALRTAIIQRMPNGKLKLWAIGNIKPQDLANLAIAGLKAKAGKVAATSYTSAGYADARMSKTQERTVRAVNPGSSEPVQYVGEAGGKVSIKEFNAFVNRFKGEQPIDNYGYKQKIADLVEEIESDWSKGSSDDYSNIFGPDKIYVDLHKENNMEYFDGDGDLTDSGSSRYNELERELSTKIAKDEIGEPERQSVSLNKAGDMAKIVHAYLEKLGIEPSAISGSGKSDSKYFSVEINGEQKTVRVSDHQIPVEYQDRNGAADYEIALYDVGDDVRSDGRITSNGITEEEASRRAVEVINSILQAQGREAMAYSKINQTDTPEFKKWFGNSKVVDADGKPLVVYHGTNADFSVFKTTRSGEFGPAIYLTDNPREAGEYGEAVKGISFAPPSANIMPVYARIENPYTKGVDAFWKEFGRSDSDAAGVERAKAAGYDGIIAKRADRYYDNVAHEFVDLGNTLTHYIAFSNTQVKSAIGNNGDFGTNPDIRYSRAKIIGDSGRQSAFDIPESSKMDDVIYAMQDKQVDLRRVVQSIKKAGGNLTDSNNAYLQEELFHGRASKGVHDFLNNELRPLVAQMRSLNVEMADFEEYLWNRHAEERNQQIAKINDQMPDGGSGIKTADARAYLKALDPAKRSAYESLAKRIGAINRSSQEILVKSGLEKQETIDAWNGAYSNYVPLHREDVDTGHVGTGKGYSIRGSASKRAVGSNKPVVDILANLAMQRERNIVRAEKNRVSNALYGLAVANPNADLWEVDKAPTERVVQNKAVYKVVDDTNGVVLDEFDRMEDAERYSLHHDNTSVEQSWADKVVTRIVPGFRQQDNVIHTRINGEDHFVIMDDKNPRSVRMAQSIKNLDMDQLGKVLSNTAKATRYMAAINTQYNPVFGVVNLTRDTQGAMLNLSTTPLAGQQKKVLKYTLSALRGIYADLRDSRNGKAPSSAWEKEFDEFQNAGGQTGFRDQYSNAQERGDAIAKELKSLDRNWLLKRGGAMFDWLSDYNESMENAVRLASFKAAKESGMSVEQAASLAKNLTVNFNRKGQVATQMGALYAFFNASVQGTARLAETMAGPMGKKILYGGLLLGSMQAMLLAASGMGDDEPPEFVRERSIIIPIGDGKYVSIPMPLGFHVIPNLSRIPTEFVMSGFKDPAKRIADIFGLFADTFNPIGNAGLSLQTIAPTVIDPLAALSENRDWTGKPIAKLDRDSLNPTPGYLRAKDTATSWSRAISYGFNLLSGGTDYKKGLFSPTPDQIDYLIGQATGGVGREVSKAEQTGMALATGEELPMHKIPLFGRFIGDTTGQSAEGGKFYASIQRINEHENEIKGLRKEGNADAIREYIKDNPEAMLVVGANHVEREIQKLKAAKREAVKADNTERVKAIESQITSRMKMFNDRVRSLSEKNAA